MPDCLKSLSDNVLVWKSRMKSPIVDLAISSMALAVFSQTQHHRPAAVEASAKYQELLQVTQTTLLTLDESNVDACLLTIFLMGRYEDAMQSPRCFESNTPFSSSLRSFSHHDGAMAILKIWKDRLRHSQPPTDTVKQTRRGLIRSALLRKRGVPEWMSDGSLFGEHGLELEYDRIMVQIANLRRQLSALLGHEAGLYTEARGLSSIVQELDDEARDIDKVLQDWTGRLPSTWNHQQFTLQEPCPWPRRHFYSSTVYSYSNPAYAAAWSQYSATRMLINSTRLRILELICPSPESFTYPQQVECFSNIKAMANDLASSLPFSLETCRVVDRDRSPFSQDAVAVDTNEEIKPHLASLMMWPLGIAASLGAADAEQKAWFNMEFACLGRIIGAGVFEHAETDQWFQL